MSNQMMQTPQTIKPARKPKPPRPVRLPVFFGFVAAGIILVIVELILFPNLVSNPGFLALAVFTTLFSFSSMGLTFSGLRPGLPKAVKWAVGIGLWGFVALDLIFLVLPSFISGPAANDEAVTFVGSTAATATPAPAVATPVPTTLTKTTAAAAIATTAATPATTLPASTTSSATTATAPATTASTATVAQTTVAAIAPKLLSGTFNNVGAEPVAGKTTLGKTADGKYVLRFEGLSSAPGPDLVVYLSTSATPSKAAEVQSGFEVAKLKSTKGDQNYELPANFDPSQYKSVVVYCKSFSVIFGYAPLN